VLLYRILMALLVPILLLRLARSGHLGERLGFGARPAPGASLWLHGASNGELVSARWVLEAVLSARPGLQVLVTVNTATARAMVAGWQLPGVTVAFAPLDGWGAAGRVLRRWQPLALVLIENELWPARIAAAARQGVPVLVIGARMSARSATRWQRLRGLIGQALARVDWLSAQDDDSLQRLLGLGLRRAAAGPVLALKAFAAQTATEPPFATPAARSETLLAASTHEGEEALILQSFLTSRFRFLIIAPRHPRRAAEIANVLTAQNIRFAQRSRNETPGPDTQVYLADTMGEMPLWYAMAGACVIGGTFADKGGHTPWEPAHAGAAILHGPSLHNFAAPFAALDAAGGAVAVTGDLAGALAGALAGLDAVKQAELATIAHTVLRPAGEPQALLDGLLAHLKADQCASG